MKPGARMARRVLVPQLAQAPVRPPVGARLLRVKGHTMGTSWEARWLADPTGAAAGREPGCEVAAMQAGIQACLDEVVAQMSSWEPDSDLSRFNRATAGTSFRLPCGFGRVLDHALAVAGDSNGAFDATAGALVDAWGFGAGSPFRDGGFQVPTEAVLAAARQASGWRRLHFDPAGGTVVQPGGLRLDLSAIAKGFGVDQVARYLQSQGIASYLVEVGGELRGTGVKPDGQPWWVMLEAPAVQGPSCRDGHDAADIDGGAETVVALYGLSIATSGDYRRFVDRDGIHYCHAIDPRTGYPVPHGVASVTVLHEDCMAADALSTALMVMGPEQGIDWAERRGVAALFRLREPPGDAAGRRSPLLAERMTARFADLLQ